MDIVEFGKQDCMKCKMTKKWLNNHNIPFKYIDVMEDKDSFNMLKDKGLTSLPVVFKDNELFCQGFDIKKLNTLL